MTPTAEQKQKINEVVNVLKEHSICLLSAKMRTGKTLMSLASAKAMNAKMVLFVTTLNAQDSVMSDWAKFNPGFFLFTINYESVHKIPKEFKPDLIIFDEAHRLGTFPKPNKAVQWFRKKNISCPTIFMSGTMTPESWSQIFHILYVHTKSPFAKYKDFYKWAMVYVEKYQVYINSRLITFYDKANIKLVKNAVNHLIVSATQEEMNFAQAKQEEVIHYVEVSPRIPQYVEDIRKKKLAIVLDKYIVADTASKEASKVHQLCSGTVLSEEKEPLVVDLSKAHYIANHFSNKKIAVYYSFKAEYLALKEVFGDYLTDDYKLFFDSKEPLIFCKQFRSGREGVPLHVCDDIIFYNIPWSYLSYDQTKARVQHKDKEQITRAHFLVSKHKDWLGVELKILKAVQNKEDFTTAHYQEWE